MLNSRRTFLKSLGAGSALWMSGCASIDKLVIGDVDDSPQKVLIIGGGLAGLTAAYELKKRQIPFRLLEASPRIGGRVWTLRNLNISSQSADLGGENIEPSHRAILTLAKELKLILNENSPVLGYSWVGKNQEISGKEWIRESQKLEGFFKKLQTETYGSSAQYLSQKNISQFPKAVALDQMSVSEFLKKSNKELSSWMSPFLQSLTESNWGARTEEMSALHLMHWMRDSYSTERRKYFRIDGGSGNLTQALYDRVAGVIPDRYIKLQHVLKRIEKTENSWQLSFETPKGSRDFVAQAVICTLPTSQYENIKGWEYLAGSENFISGPQRPAMASMSKAIMSFKDRFWREHSVLGGGGQIISENGFSNLSAAGAIPNLGLGTVHGLLQAQLGAGAADKINPESFKSLLDAIQKIDNKAISSYGNIFHVQNWKTYPWSKGGRAFMAPKQYQNWKDSDTGFSNAETWAFAGDAHSLAYMGSMNGAVDSAQIAVERLAKILV